ncbi:uncharacterized protein CC84DRAFT_1169939, partial [Paraphaeosphaeria sporulosa]
MDRFLTRSQASQASQSTQSTQVASSSSGSYHYAGSRTAAVMAMTDSFGSVDDSLSDADTAEVSADPHVWPGDLRANRAQFPIQHAAAVAGSLGSISHNLWQEEELQRS